MQRLARIKQATIDLYKRRKLARFNWWFIYLAANLLRKAWKAQWSLVFKTEAARQLAIAQQEMSLHIQRKWRDRVAFRYARQLRFVVVAHLQDMQSIGSNFAGTSAETFVLFCQNLCSLPGVFQRLSLVFIQLLHCALFWLQEGCALQSCCAAGDVCKAVEESRCNQSHATGGKSVSKQGHPSG